MAELLDLPPEMKARRYLELADDARRSAAACKGQLSAHYLFLAEQWEKLASDFAAYLKQNPASESAKEEP